MLADYYKRSVATIAISLIFCPPVLAATTATTTESTDSSATAIVAEPEISVWVDSAPLSLMVDQLGFLTGLKVSIDSDLEGHVSGRYTGSLQDTLASLAADHGVLFDLQDETLHVVNKTDSTSVSVALSEHALTPGIEQTFSALGDTRLGNAVEFREDAVRVSGHPDFVRRTALKITSTIADVGGAKSTQETVPSVAAMPNVADDEVVVDAGSTAVLENIQEQSKPETEQALSRPIRWVTDIPGFDTF